MVEVDGDGLAGIAVLLVVGVLVFDLDIVGVIYKISQTVCLVSVEFHGFRMIVVDVRGVRTAFAAKTALVAIYIISFLDHKLHFVRQFRVLES